MEHQPLSQKPATLRKRMVRTEPNNFYVICPFDEQIASAELIYHACIRQYTSKRHLFQGELLIELAVLEPECAVVAIAGKWDDNKGLELPKDVNVEWSISVDTKQSTARKSEYSTRLRMPLKTTLITERGIETKVTAPRRHPSKSKPPDHAPSNREKKWWQFWKLD